MAGRVALDAPAKVNLALHVIGRRADGYHLLDSIAVFADVGDRVEIEAADALRLSVAGPFASQAPGDSTDLAWRAAAAFFEATDPLPRNPDVSGLLASGTEVGNTRLRTGTGLGEGSSKTPASLKGPHPQPHPTRGRGVHIRVEKNIPAGAGLGGGSADAAAVLVGLDRHFGTRLSADALAAIGVRLGADVPMCLSGRALRARGIGEDIRAIEAWPPLSLVLVWPGRPLSTTDAFKTLARRDNPPLGEPPQARSPKEIALWLSGCRNDLESPALALAPEIGETLVAFRGADGCLLARMSGSGSACFGLFADEAAAWSAAASLSRAHTNWWVKATIAR